MSLECLLVSLWHLSVLWSLECLWLSWCLCSSATLSLECLCALISSKRLFESLRSWTPFSASLDRLCLSPWCLSVSEFFPFLSFSPKSLSADSLDFLLFSSFFDFLPAFLSTASEESLSEWYPILLCLLNSSSLSDEEFRFLFLFFFFLRFLWPLCASISSRSSLSNFLYKNRIT